MLAARGRFTLHHAQRDTHCFLSGCSMRYFVAPASLVAVSCFLMFLSGCPAAPFSDLGVTGGGQQDLASARLAIEAGEVPDPDAITVEGLISEHSVPLEPPADAGLLYATVGTAWNRDFDAFTPLVTVQIGFGSTLDLEDFQRPDLNLCIVIDRSGSMGDDIERRTDATKLDAVKIAIDRLLPHLTADDRVSIVAFDTGSRLALEAARGNDYDAIKAALDTITAGGGTDLVPGLARGYQTVLAHANDSRSDRVLLFTDAQLRFRQELAARSFINEISDYADRGIGTTVFGVGSDFGDEIVYDISQVRGGNYFFLGSYERIVSVFDEDFDLLVTPVAYDVEMTVTIPAAFDLAGVYGLPEEFQAARELTLNLPTLFFSRRQGGGIVFVRLRGGSLVDFTQPITAATVALSYKTPDGNTVTPAPLAAELPGELSEDADPPYFSSSGVQRGVLLLNTALVLKGACEDIWGDYYSGSYYWYYYGDPDRAAERISEFLPYFDTLAEGLDDRADETSRGLSDERALLERLLQNVSRYR
ncbi:MAG: VWA domain-containing protein [Phycisphaerae bacterium]|nr:VWA domain-containing protein [Phycisphaerae bacterium]